MTSSSLFVANTGLVTSVGFNAAASCAAIRAKVSNPSETYFMGPAHQRIAAHQVLLEQSWRGRTKLAKMAMIAIEDCLAHIPRAQWLKIPLLLCVAERERPGRLEGLDDELYEEIEDELDVRFAEQSLVIPHGRTSYVTALLHARRLISEGASPLVLIVASDSFLHWPTLSALIPQDRLLIGENSNGFIPGEGAGAVLMEGSASGPGLRILGLGMAAEPVTIETEQPLRGDGLTTAIKRALGEAGCELHELDFRITDLSGEQYYFKEAALALGRIVRVHKEEFDVWHPAECIGEAGAMAGVAQLVVAHAACHKGYAPGLGILCHAAADNGQRAAAVLRYQAA